MLTLYAVPQSIPEQYQPLSTWYTCCNSREYEHTTHQQTNRCIQYYAGTNRVRRRVPRCSVESNRTIQAERRASRQTRQHVRRKRVNQAGELTNPAFPQLF